MGKFVFERDYETLLAMCGGDEDFAMDIVMYLLNHKNRSIQEAIVDTINTKKKSCDAMDNYQLCPIDDIDMLYMMPEVDTEAISLLAKAILSLSSREIVIIYHRFFKGNTLRESANALHVTPERARQIEAKALRKLRHPSRSRKIYESIEQDYSYIGYDCYSFDRFLSRLISISGISEKSADILIKDIEELKNNNRKTEKSVIEFADLEEEKEKLFMEYIFSDIPGFINNSNIKLPKVLYNSVLVVLSVFKERKYKRIDKVSEILYLLSEYKGDNYIGIQLLINELNRFVQEYKYHDPSFINKRDKYWLYFYYLLKSHKFSTEAAFAYNAHLIPGELQTILDYTSYCRYYIAHGPIFSDEDDLLIYSLYSGKTIIEYQQYEHYGSLCRYIMVSIYPGVNIDFWKVYDKELSNQNKLNRLYDNLDHITLRTYKFPTFKGDMDPEDIRRDAINFVYPKSINKNPLYLSIKPRRYIQDVMQGYYESLLFLSKIGETKLLTDIGIPMKDIEFCAYNLPAAVIASTFIWINSIIPNIKFSTSDFYDLYNLYNDEILSDRLDIMIDYAKIIVKLDQEKDADIISATIELLKQIIRK